MIPDLGFIFSAGLVLVLVLCSICIWAPRRLAVKVGTLAVAGMFIPVGYASLTELLSKPKPVQLEWWQGQVDKATVLASSVEEGKAIYVWLQLDNSAEPRAYALPWNPDMAQQLQDATREAQDTEGRVAMRMPFEPSIEDREPRFYALPQPAPPPKGDDLPPPAQRYAPPGLDA